MAAHRCHGPLFLLNRVIIDSSGELTNRVCRGENSIPLRGMREGRNGGAVRYTAGQHPDKLRPCKHWCGGQPVDETGSGQA